MSIVLDIIADYSKNPSDLAFAEVKNTFLSLSQDIKHVSCYGVSAFNTIENAFFTTQIAANSKIGKGHVIFHNVAPRKDDTKARSNNEGEKLAFCILPNNVIVVGVFSGYSFDFLNEITDIFVTNCDFHGSQFRSRDVFPQYTMKLVEKHLNNESLSEFIVQTIQKKPSQIPNNTICYIDGYGNIKTNITIPAKDLISVKIKDIQKEIKINNLGVFSAKDGDFILTQGSSGWNTNGVSRTFTEIFLRGGDASSSFGNPKVGDIVSLDTK